MKRLILISILLGFIAAPAYADFTFNIADVLAFGKIDDYTLDTHDGTLPPDPDLGGVATFLGATTNDADYGATHSLPAGSVGLVASNVGWDGSYEWIGLGITGVNLSSDDTYVVTLNNDNDDVWKYQLFADDGATAGGFVSGSWTTIAAGNSATLNLPYSGLDASSRIGIMVGSDYHENTAHTSVVPEPATIALLGLGALSLICRRRKQSGLPRTLRS